MQVVSVIFCLSFLLTYRMGDVGGGGGGDGGEGEGGGR